MGASPGRRREHTIRSRHCDRRVPRGAQGRFRTLASFRGPQSFIRSSAHPRGTRGRADDPSKRGEPNIVETSRAPHRGGRSCPIEAAADTPIPEQVEMAERIRDNWMHSRTPAPPDADVPPKRPSVTILNTRAALPQGNVATRVTACPTRMKNAVSDLQWP